MLNLLPLLKKSISMNREIYELKQSWEIEKQNRYKKIEEMNKAFESALTEFQIEQMGIIPRQSGRGLRPYHMICYNMIAKEIEIYKEQKAIMSIKAKYQGNRAKRRSKNKTDNINNEPPKTLQDVINQKRNRIRYSFNSKNISNRFVNNKYDKGLNNKW